MKKKEEKNIAQKNIIQKNIIQKNIAQKNNNSIYYKMPKLDHVIIRPNIRAILNILPILTITKFFKKLFSFKKPESLLYLALGLVLVYILVYYVLPTNMVFKENFDLFNSNSSIDSMNNDKSTKLVYFYMNGCGHCKNFTPTWDKFCAANSSTIKTYKFEQAQVREQINTYAISGFPAILLLDENNAKIDEYNGQRTLEGLTSYVNGHALRS